MMATPFVLGGAVVAYVVLYGRKARRRGPDGR
jgi:hypothetical protein